jgi:hypothetical protein
MSLVCRPLRSHDRNVDAISNRDGERFFDYIRRCRLNPLATLVKLADLDDNSDPKRRYGRDYESLLRRYGVALVTACSRARLGNDVARLQAVTEPRP